MSRTGISRRTAFKAAAGLPLLWKPDAARAAARTLSGRRFDRGINVWPWFSFPAAFPTGGAGYPTWPPYDPDRPVPTSTDLAALAAAGFDHIRLPVNPAPFLYLAAVGQSAQFWRLMGNVVDAVTMADAAGLGIIVALQPEAVEGFTAENLYGLSAPSSSFDTYTNLIANLAKVLATLPIERLALEPVNEPPQQVVPGAGVTATAAGVAAADWAAKQKTLLRTARTYAPKLKLVATGAYGGSIAGLVQIDPSTLTSLGPLLYTFHFYDPYLFSHQGAPWLARANPLYAWLNAVPWPASAGSLPQTMAAVKARMSRSSYGYGSSALQSHYQAINAALQPYFHPPIDRDYFSNDVGTGNAFFGTLADWMKNHGVGPEGIIMGEFGALKTTAVVSAVTGGPYEAATPADRARYIGDLRVTAENHGFGWSLWTLFNPGMGIMDETSRTLDPAVIASLGLTMPN